MRCSEFELSEIASVTCVSITSRRDPVIKTKTLIFCKGFPPFWRVLITRHASTNRSKSNGEGKVGAGLEVVAAPREELLPRDALLVAHSPRA